MNQLLMTPSPGERRLQFLGDRVRFTLRDAAGAPLPPGWRAWLRTEIGRAAALREDVVASRAGRKPRLGGAWHDVPMQRADNEWTVELALAEVGFFHAKAYAVDPRGWQLWPDGADAGISVQPDRHRAGNTIYCAFTRMFGPTKTAATTRDPKLDTKLAALDKKGFTVIPPSGKLRDLARELPHIFQTLGCRILHLLPVNPTPTVTARFGRFGSPYAATDLTAIDPALVDFDRRTTAVEQFRELTDAAHCLGGRVFIDLVTNHTGWHSTLQEAHPEWFQRTADGTFASPGAWGVTWEDLVELDPRAAGLWDELAEVFLTWCRRGVDGFRCDAGYKVPMPVWQYITARVRQEFPETIFLLEGLGGGWLDTEALLTEGGMQWAYSELFQELSGAQVGGYLDHALKQSRRCGVLVHYSETHDNDRLAARGAAWSRHRNQLCALTSVAGGFGFTAGVEWLCAEKINVHSARGLAWGATPNLVDELARLNRLLAEHPCFFADADLERVSPPGSQVYALRRVSGEGRDTVLVLANTDFEHAQAVTLSENDLKPVSAADKLVELLGQPLPTISKPARGEITFQLPPGAVLCLSDHAMPRGLAGPAYRQRMARIAFGVAALSHHLPAEEISAIPSDLLDEWIERAPAEILGALGHLRPGGSDPQAALRAAANDYPLVVTWSIADVRRIVPLPPRHWLLVRDTQPFRMRWDAGAGRLPQTLESIAVRDGHIACVLPPDALVGSVDAQLQLERYGERVEHLKATVRLLAEKPFVPEAALTHKPGSELVLFTNGRGGMSRLCVDLGRITSKYDCLLGANLHATVPVDRHVLAKRLRAWVNADGFTSPLNADNLASFTAGPPAHWRFVAHAGDRRVVGIDLQLDLLADTNTVVARFERYAIAPGAHSELPPNCDVRLTVRVDLEDRNFHWETKRNGGSEHHFAAHTRALAQEIGFEFTPAADRRLRVVADGGAYHAQPEWSENILHPVEGTRGMTDCGDAFSPGWFELPLASGRALTLLVSADAELPARAAIASFAEARRTATAQAVTRAGLPEHDTFGRALARAVQAFLVRRNSGRTVIAGYPWFLDWGRDTLICARGLLAAGALDEVGQILREFGKFENGGTLPNAIHGDDASNRDTSDAPLWFGLACEGWATATNAGSVARLLKHTKVADDGRSLADVLRAIAAGYLAGTTNGIRVDAESGLVWSPAHFTWMDTNHPAATPREGYPVEIQALWIRLLRLLERLGAPPATEKWSTLAARAEKSFAETFWLEEQGWLADLLIAKPGVPAAAATVDTALRSNALLPVSLGMLEPARARSVVAAAVRHLLIPGAVRSLAPLPVTPPLPVHGANGQLLNNPAEPYWGRYEGDEDTRRKPAYHNGTAWCWTLPVFCEALVRAWDFSPAALAAARATLGSLDRLLLEQCLGHVPEIVDGDAPHTPRGCDAQAWSVTEALRVWKLLSDASCK